MSYNDEERIKRKNMAMAGTDVEDNIQENTSIFEGAVNLHGVESIFEERQIGDFPCYIYMPKQFRLMTEEEKSILFARTKPPKYAYGAEDLLLFLSVSITESPMKNEQIRMFMSACKSPLEALIPQSKVYKTYVTEVDGRNIGHAEFVSGGIGGKIYNLMMFLCVGDKLLIINIYTQNELKQMLFPYMEQMAESLRIEDKKDAADNI